MIFLGVSPQRWDFSCNFGFAMAGVTSLGPPASKGMKQKEKT
jgi:hypothetical protein